MKLNQDVAPHPTVPIGDIILRQPAEQPELPQNQFSDSETEAIQLAAAVARSMNFAEYGRLKKRSEETGVKLQFEYIETASTETTARKDSKLAFEGFTRIETSAPKPEHDDSQPLTSTRRLGIALAGVLALGGIGALADASPAAANTSSSGGMSNKEIVDRCNSLRIVVHKGTTTDGGGSKGPDVNTVRWMKQVFHRGSKFIEGDEQVTDDGVDAALHDDNMAATTTGTGEVHERPASYVLHQRTNSGDPIATPKDKVKVMKQFPNAHFIEELKDYHKQWTPTYVQQLVDTYSKAKVLDQVSQFTSAAPRVLSMFDTLYSNLSTALIGFGGYRPDPNTAAKVGAEQVNVSFQKASSPYRGYDTYIEAVHDTLGKDGLPLKISLRSLPNGKGDDARTFTKEIEEGVDQLVVQDLTEHQVCTAVANYLKHGRDAAIGSQRIMPLQSPVPALRKNHATQRRG